MKTFELYYLNYEGETKTATLEVLDGEDAGEAIRNWVVDHQDGGDGVHLLLSVREL
jgi:hypothetical protein